MASPTPEHYREHLRQVFSRLQDHGLRINPEKCVLAAACLDFLGFQVNQEGIRPLEDKVKTIREFPLPSTQRKLRQFLGLVNFYNRFLPSCAQTLQPLHDLLKGAPKGNTPLSWTPAATTAFHSVKDALADASLLVHPRPHAPTCILTDASSVAVGAVLQQRLNNSWCPIAYFSRKLTPAQMRYSTFDRELLAIYLAIKHFQHFIEGRDFYVCTDHKPLTFALRARPDKHSPRQARYLDFIAQFTTDIRHLPGQDNAAADTLSRMEVDALEHPADSPWDVHTLATAQRQEEAPTPTSTSLMLQSIPVPTTNITILCDMSTGTPRPYVPPSLRRPIFDHYHSLSHPGVRATQRLLTSRFVWPRTDERRSQTVDTCLHQVPTFQGAHPHGFPSWHLFATRCPLCPCPCGHGGSPPPSQGYTYLLTCVDRFTRWPESIPRPNITTEAVAHAFLSGWISRFGVPTTLTSDRGSQFESGLCMVPADEPPRYPPFQDDGLPPLRKRTGGKISSPAQGSTDGSLQQHLGS